ncbi:hypothetical protein J6590_044662 [Homalodisca vitripennis]|nr:hypothetical protein J6590_044662 [Homalodisca vitripennis]
MQLHALTVYLGNVRRPGQHNNITYLMYVPGMVKTYQLSTETQFGISRKLAPMTTETELNTIKCFQVNGTQKDKIRIQSVLPDLTGFEMVGQEMINGLMTDKWRKIDNKGEKVNKYTMYLRWKKSPKAPKVQIPIPVRYEMKGYNSLLGSHYDHYYLNYDEFSWDTPPADVFDVKPPNFLHIISQKPTTMDRSRLVRGNYNILLANVATQEHNRKPLNDCPYHNVRSNNSMNDAIGKKSSLTVFNNTRFNPLTDD